MKSTAIVTALLFVVFGATLVGATPGVQVVSCEEVPPGSGQWYYEFYVCSGDFLSNGVHLELVQDEIDQGTAILDCSVPTSPPGISCDSDATSVSYFFDTLSPFSCIPGEADMYLGVTILTPDGFTVVTERWTLDGDSMGLFGTSMACPPVATSESTWSTVKSMF
jgi:hypothetical protein